MADDIAYTSNPHMWITIGTYSSPSENWIRTTRVMQLPEAYGCIVQTETEIETGGVNREISQSTVLVPGISIKAIAENRPPNPGSLGL